MKATVDLAPELLADARAAAARRGWTVRVVFEESLRAFLQNEEAAFPKAPFQLGHTIVKGERAPDMTFQEMLDASDLNRWH